MVITIDRKYGSGGRMVGEKLAKILGYDFYDRELLKLSAQESGIHEDVVARFDEKAAGSLLYSTYLYATMPIAESLPLNQKLAFAQFDVIRRLADQGNCVIVGRCADYVLADRTDCVHLFITANDEIRQQRLVKYYGIPKELTAKTMKKQDKMRAEYYNFFTDQKWDNSQNYHISIDAGHFGLDVTAALIAAAVRQLGGEQ